MAGFPTLRTRLIATLAALAALVFGAPNAGAKVIWHVDGAGYGHGVGMSQFGARGLAAHGARWEQILAHYYPGTSIGSVKPTSITVLLAPDQGAVSFSGAGIGCGLRLYPAKTYEAIPAKSGIELWNFNHKRKLGECGSLLTATGTPTWNLVGKGTYRGALQVRPSPSGGLNAINWVTVDDYVRGVVPSEIPLTWPLQALRAQAVAARSYALSTGNWGADYMLYDDTRSQVYGGVGAETPRTDAAVADTSLQVVADGASVARTYFFSTSGGHTEAVQNVLGGGAIPYLQGVPDPYDAASPYHRWHETLSQAGIESALSGLFKGTLEQIKITKTGASPRVLSAELVGSDGKTTVDGATLQSRLGLRDRWVSFHKIDTDAVRRYSRPWAPS